METTYLSGRLGYSLLVLLFISAGLNGCLGGPDEINGDSQKVPIILALETDLDNVEGISDDSLLSILDISSEFSVITYPVDSEAAKIGARDSSTTQLWSMAPLLGWVGRSMAWRYWP